MTTASETVPDAWKEFCLVGIIPEDGSEVQFAALTEDITAMDWGERDIEGIKLLNGGNVVKTSPMTDESITLKMWPVNTGNSGTGVTQLFHPIVSTGAYADDSSQPITVNNSIYRRKYGIIITWCTMLPATAGTATGTNKPAYRIQIINAYMTKCKPDYSDKMLSYECTFKWTPFNKSGTYNKREESTDGTSILPIGITSATTF